LRHDRVGLHHSSPSILDRRKGGPQPSFRDPFPPVVPVHKEACYPPQLCFPADTAALSCWSPDGVTPRVDPRELVLRPVLAPSYRNLSIIDERRVRTAFPHQLPLVFPVDLFPCLP